MKIIRVLCLFTVLVLAISLCGCGKGIEKENKLNIVAVGFSHFDFARAVAGNNADITMLLKPGSESHTFEPTPRDIENIRNCDIFIYTGGESDVWVDGILNSLDTGGMVKVKFTDYVKLEKEEPTVVENHDKNEVEEEYDEHVWTSPKNAIGLVTAVKTALQSKDAENSDIYETNARAYISEIEQIDSEISECVNNSSKKVLVFADRFPLLYFVKEYGLNYKAAFSGCAEKTEPTPESVAEIIKTVKENNINTVFKIELSDGRMAKSISDETGAEVRVFYSCHNVSKSDFENNETYISLMKRNSEALKIALD